MGVASLARDTSQLQAEKGGLNWSCAPPLLEYEEKWEMGVASLARHMSSQIQPE